MRFLAGSVAIIALVVGLGHVVYGQQPLQPFSFTPFTLTAERANELVALPLTPDSRDRLLAQLRQWSDDEARTQQQGQLQQQATALKAQMDELSKPKPTETKPEAEPIPEKKP
jgi:hypothetical protein